MIKLTFFNLSVFNAESCRFFLLSFNSFVELMIEFVNFSHCRLVFMISWSSDCCEFSSLSFVHSQNWWSSRVDFLYCLNAIERWIFFICRLFFREDDEQFRAIDEYEFAFEESSNISKNTFHDLSDRIALSKQLQHHCHEQHTLIRTHNLLNRHEQWLHELRVISKYRQIENFDVCDVKTLNSMKTH